MGQPFLVTKVNVIGADIVKAKLAMAEPRILAQNRAMVTEMLRLVKAEIIPETPLGPGHFGYHLRDRYVIDVKSTGLKTVGVLKAPAQGYWREFGTGARHRSSRRGIGTVVFGTGSLGSGGERAFMTAHHALAGVRKFISFYYGGLAKWWHL